jgi:hypothetical protein
MVVPYILRVWASRGFVMPDKKTSPLHVREEAKSTLNKAESAWRKILNARNRLSRERYQTKGEVTEAENEAERAYEMAASALTHARENWNLIQTTVPKPKAKRQPRMGHTETGLAESEVG